MGDSPKDLSPRYYDKFTYAVRRKKEGSNSDAVNSRIIGTSRRSSSPLAPTPVPGPKLVAGSPTPKSKAKRKGAKKVTDATPKSDPVIETDSPRRDRSGAVTTSSFPVPPHIVAVMDELDLRLVTDPATGLLVVESKFVSPSSNPAPPPPMVKIPSRSSIFQQNNSDSPVYPSPPPNTPSAALSSNALPTTVDPSATTIVAHEEGTTPLLRRTVEKPAPLKKTGAEHPKSAYTGEDVKFKSPRNASSKRKVLPEDIADGADAELRSTRQAQHFIDNPYGAFVIASTRDGISEAELAVLRWSTVACLYRHYLTICGARLNPYEKSVVHSVGLAKVEATWRKAKAQVNCPNCGQIPHHRDPSPEDDSTASSNHRKTKGEAENIATHEETLPPPTEHLSHDLHAAEIHGVSHTHESPVPAPEFHHHGYRAPRHRSTSPKRLSLKWDHVSPKVDSGLRRFHQADFVPL